MHIHVFLPAGGCLNRQSQGRPVDRLIKLERDFLLDIRTDRRSLGCRSGSSPTAPSATAEQFLKDRPAPAALPAAISSDSAEKIGQVADVEIHGLAAARAPAPGARPARGAGSAGAA